MRVPELTALPRSFFSIPAELLAPRLLGCHLVCGEVVVRLTEVEAYLGEADPGSHAYRGRTARNATMFGAAGHLYVYRHMGLHICMNLVASTVDHANGVLLRAGEVVVGADVARRRRAANGVTRRDTDLAQGPGRLTVTCGIVHADDGLDVVPSRERTPKLWVADRAETPEIVRGARIGLRAEASDPARYPLRFWITGDPTVSGSGPANRAGVPME